MRGNGTMDRPRVAVVIKTSQGAKWLVPQVRQMVNRGANVLVALPEGEGHLAEDLDATGARVERLAWDFSFKPHLSTIAGLNRLRRTVQRHGASVVFYHLYASALAGRFASLGLPVRRVMMVAGPLYLENSTIRRVERILCRLDHAIVAGSDYTRRMYAALGYPESQMEYIPYGVDCERFRPAAPDRSHISTVGESDFVAIMVAFVYAPKDLVFPGVGIKGHELLLQAWSRFSKVHAEVKLLLVGGGFDQESEEYRQGLMSRYGIAERSDVDWLDSVEDVRPYYSRAHVSVSPSLSENHGAALEASAMGVPSIVSEAGGLPETVSQDSGWVVQTGSEDAILEALEQAYLAKKSGQLDEMGGAARSRALEMFDEADCSRRVADIVLREAVK